MRIQYTKQQIIESIKYWQRRLQLMNEAQAAILNALEKEFGKIIYDNVQLIPTNDIMNKTFDILNKTLFSNQLPKINVQCLTTNQIQQIFDSHKHVRDASKLYAVYFPLTDFTKINYVKKNQMPNIHYLMINVTNEQNANFSFYINSLCHEMIHYLDTIKGDVLLQWKIKYDSHDLESFNEHTTDIFMKKSQQFNKQGMSIIPDDGGFTQSQLNDFSSERMKRLQEMEDDLIDSNISSKSHIVATDLGNGIFAISF